MARQRGKETPPRKKRAADVQSDENEKLDPAPGGVPELVRRALTIGLTGFFTTEEAVRKALGDTLPKDWIDFAVDQSGRARQEFLDRVSNEISRSMSDMDLAELLAKLLEGRTLEVSARIKLVGDPDAKRGVRVERNTEGKG